MMVAGGGQGRGDRRAVRMVFEQVFEHEGDHAPQWGAIGAIAAKIGCTAETLRGWVRQAERDQGKRLGPTTDEQERFTSDRCPSVGPFRPGWWTACGRLVKMGEAPFAGSMFRMNALHRRGPYRPVRDVMTNVLSRFAVHRPTRAATEGWTMTVQAVGGLATVR